MPGNHNRVSSDCLPVRKYHPCLRQMIDIERTLNTREHLLFHICPRVLMILSLKMLLFVQVFLIMDFLYEAHKKPFLFQERCLSTTDILVKTMTIVGGIKRPPERLTIVFLSKKKDFLFEACDEFCLDSEMESGCYFLKHHDYIR